MALVLLLLLFAAWLAAALEQPEANGLVIFSSKPQTRAAADNMTMYYKRVALGAAGLTALFYLARRGYLGASIQTTAIEVSTMELIPGVKF